MADPQEERLEALEQEISDARRQAEEHGSIPAEDPKFIDPDGDGDEERAEGAPPPG